MDWRIRFLFGVAKGLLPFPETSRKLQRRLRPYRPDPFNDEQLVHWGIRQVRALRDCGCDLKGAQVMEVGSGWVPIIPLIFRMAGAQAVLLTDQEKLMDVALLRHAIAVVAANRAKIETELGLAVDQTLLAPFDAPDLERALARLGMRYAAPYEVSAIPASSVDVVISRSVLEQVPPPLLAKLMGQWRRILVSGGFMCHVIDNSDHWHHVDPKLTPINFLRFSDTAWNLISRTYKLNYTNRLRHSEYVGLMDQAGFDLVLEEARVDDRALEAAATLRLAPRFASFEVRDIASLTSLLVSRAKPGGSVP